MSKIDLFAEPDYKIEVVEQKDPQGNIIDYDILINGKRIEEIDPANVTDLKLKKILELK